MLRRLTESAGNVLGYAVEHEVTTQDVATMQAELRQAMVDHDAIRVVIDVTDLDRVEPGAVWQDLKMLREYVTSLERMAVIGDRRWHQWSAAATEVATDTRFFEPHEADRAWAWIREVSSTDDV